VVARPEPSGIPYADVESVVSEALTLDAGRESSADLRGARPDARGLRVALFSGNYNYTRDGANQALNRLVGYLLASGAAVRVYSPTTATPAFEPVGDLVSVPSIPVPGRGEYRLALGLPRRLREDIRAFAPTVFHLSAPDLLGLRARNFARALGVPVVSSIHTRFETYLAYYGLGWLTGKVEAYLQSFYRGCDALLPPNAPMGELLAQQLPDAPIRLWPRGVDRVQFSPERRSSAWRTAVGLRPDDVAVLFLGRVVQEKGLGILADTFARLDQRVRPLIIGDGPARAWLQERLPNAIFTGFLTGDDLGQAVASAEVMFNPSLTETFGNATLEAMACGLPIVAAPAPSTRNLIQHGREGLVAETHDAAAYAAALLQLAADPELRGRMGRAARETSRRFDWDACCSHVLSCYREFGGLPAAARTAGAHAGG
jgi:glycosyltransferase involved in cell wall biosynthesis